MFLVMEISIIMYTRMLNILIVMSRCMVFNAIFKNISGISWRSVLLVEETGVPGEFTDLSQVTSNVHPKAFCHYSQSYVTLHLYCLCHFGLLAPNDL